jgi:hypothetical protein
MVEVSWPDGIWACLGAVGAESDDPTLRAVFEPYDGWM